MTATHKDPAFRFASELLDEHLSDAQAIWGALELAVEHHPNLQGQEQYSHEITVLLRILGGKLQEVSNASARVWVAAGGESDLFPNGVTVPAKA